MSDEWGGDPAVKIMRRVFAAMESAQKEFLSETQISPFEPRLRGWRQGALTLFERSWAVARRRCLDMDEKRAAEIYIACLAHLMASQGVPVERKNLKAEKEVEEVIREVLR